MEVRFFNLKRFFLTIDFEKFSLIENFQTEKQGFSVDDTRISYQLDLLLCFLDKLKIKSTFFVLGQTAEEHPELIKKIFINDHEIASHGYSHKMLNKLNIRELEEDIQKSKIILEEIIQKPILGYRAPCFSIVEDLSFMLEKYNFKYDSSLNFSSFNSRYTKLSNIQKIKEPFKLPNSKIFEIPLSTLSFLFDKEIPISGGGMGRLIPRYLWLELCTRYLKHNKNLVFYTHPWEIDPQLPFVYSSLKKTFATYYNVSRYLKKLEYMIDSLNKKFPECKWQKMMDLEIIKTKNY